MPLPRTALPAALLLLLAGGGALLLLPGGPPPSPPPDAEPPPRAPARGAGGRAPPAPALPRPLEAPPAPSTVPDDPEWHTRPLRLPAGDGPLRGRDLIAAVEAGGPLRVRGATPADLEALARTEFTDIDRAAPTPVAALLGWLKEAGFLVEAEYPVLVVRRRTDEEPGSR